MHYTVLLQSTPDNGYIAAALALPNCVGIGKTEKDALENVRKLMSETLSRSKLVTIDVDTDPSAAFRTCFVKTENDPSRWFGAFEDDETWGELFDEIERLRDLTVEKG